MCNGAASKTAEAEAKVEAAKEEEAARRSRAQFAYGRATSMAPESCAKLAYIFEASATEFGQV